MVRSVAECFDPSLIVCSLELLAPLTSAAHLPDHPSLSVPYLTPILSNMTQEACKMLQRERNTIRGAKQLLTKLRGDETWIPCGSLDSDTDDIIFDTSKVLEECIRSCPSRKIADKEDDITLSDTTLLPLDDTVGTSPKADRLAGLDTEDEAGSAFPRAKTDGHRLVDEPDIPKSLLNASDHMKGSQGIEIAPVDGDDGTTVRQDFEASRDTSGAHPALPEVHETSSLGANSLLNDTTQAVSAESIALNGVNGAVAGASADLIDGDRTSTTDGALNFDKKSNLPSVVTLTGLGGLLTDANEVIPMMDIEGSQAISDGLQPIAHRMTTRAQAQAVSDNTTSSRARSVSVASSSIPSIHPLFLMPSGACPDRDFGLSPDEAEATRRILMSFIQKQEEVCRGTEKLYNGLLKMERMKKNVWDSCKAEGHIGEMSDGEDWYDKEKWGLEEDLRKGHDEEEDDVGTQHKKTRQRRA